ncbi:ribonuclease P protein subunit p21 [Aethina tumida]|uniref:ribonuclease P protein subunit p21 n=1 Tax=Aethina tumida TaxID=116153 RepID=UPI00096B1122|nr:ribonuclease P protein subunit p21 [Aethina tumida]
MKQKGSKCVGKVSFQRMNYLYQICNSMAAEDLTSNAVASKYSDLIIKVARKTVQRIGINVKRTLCKRCRSLLVAGVTCKVRIKKKRVVWNCLRCNLSKEYATDPNHHPWPLDDRSTSEIIKFGPITAVNRERKKPIRKIVKNPEKEQTNTD